jgi:hypothetical protein
VLGRSESLSDWTASTALADASRIYLYRRGTAVDVPLAPGAVREERFPIGPDDSWGTYFTPRRGARYTVDFAVVTPDVKLDGVEAHLTVDAVVGCL